MEIFFLFISSFLAATIFPAQSELVLAGLSASGNYNKILLLSVATFGNVLGALVNWFLGVYFVKFKDQKWFPVKKPTLTRAMKFYQKWGIWTLFFSWLPIIGDPLTLIAGIFRTNIWIFLLFVTIGKAVRYLVIIGIF